MPWLNHTLIFLIKPSILEMFSPVMRENMFWIESALLNRASNPVGRENS